MELLDGGVYGKDEAENNCYAEITSSDSAHILRSSSYEDIYVGTKLPGDEPADDKGDVVNVSDVGDRFDSRPLCTSVPKQSGGRRSSSFENLYELQDRQAYDRDVAEMETDILCAGVRQWQMKDGSEDLTEKDSLAPIPSRMWQARRSCPIDITVESGLDRVGQSVGYGASTAKRTSCHLLQHSMSYDVEMDKKTRHRNISSGSSLEGDDDGADFLRGRNTTSGIIGMVVVAQRNCVGCRFRCCVASYICVCTNFRCKPLYS